MKVKLVIAALVVLVALTEARAQYVFVPDQTGRPLTDARYENLTGTPYFIDDWLKGEVKLGNGELVKPMALKFDMVTNKLLFQADGKVYEFFPKAVAFNLHTQHGVKTFLWKDEQKTGSYYEVLCNGDIKLLKKNKKTILEVKGYNSANIQKTVDENKKYVVIYKGEEHEVKLTKKSLAEALPNFKTSITNYPLAGQKNMEQSYIDLVSALKEN